MTTSTGCDCPTDDLDDFPAYRALALAVLRSAYLDRDSHFFNALNADFVLWCETAGLRPDLVLAALRRCARRRSVTPD